VTGFLLSNSSQFGISSDPNDIELLEVHRNDSGNLLIFNQLYNGRPILDAGINVKVDRNSNIESIKIDKLVNRSSIQFSISEVDSKKIVLDLLGSSYKEIEVSEPEESYMVDNKSLVPIFILMVKTSKPSENFRFIVHRYTGKIISQLDLSINLPSPKALLFVPNPIITLRSVPKKFTSFNESGLKDEIDQRGHSKDVRFALNKLREEVGLFEVEGDDKSIRLTSQYAFIDASEQSMTANPLDFEYNTDAFHKIMVHYHIYNYANYINNLNKNKKYVHNPVEVEIDPRFNFPATCLPDKIKFGTPTYRDENNYAEDGKAVVHEYSHFIFGKLTKGTIPQDGRIDYEALSEAYAILLPCIFFSGEKDTWSDNLYDWAVFGPNSPKIDRLRERGFPHYYEWTGDRERGLYDGRDDTDDLGGFILASSLWNVFLEMGGDSKVIETRKTARDIFFRLHIDFMDGLAKSTTIREAMKAFLNSMAKSDNASEEVLRIYLKHLQYMGVFRGDRNANLVLERSPGDNKVQLQETRLNGGASVWIEMINDRPSISVCVKNTGSGRLESALMKITVLFDEGAQKIEESSLYLVFDLESGSDRVFSKRLWEGATQKDISGARISISMFSPGGEFPKEDAFEDRIDLTIQ